MFYSCDQSVHIIYMYHNNSYFKYTISLDSSLLSIFIKLKNTHTAKKLKKNGPRIMMTVVIHFGDL